MPDPDGTNERNALRCGECDTTLAFDQRYCLECGARRGAMPAHAAASVAAILDRGRLAPTSRGPAAAPGAPHSRRLEIGGGWSPTPRAAAVAVMGMLGFGVVVGSTVGAGVASVVRPAIVLLVGGSSNRSAAGSAALGASGTAGGGVRTIVSVITSGGPSAPASLAPSPPPPVAPTTTPSQPSGYYGLPPIKHVFLIMLSDQGYTQTFGSQNEYFARTLPKQGELFPFYYGVTSGELANEIALVSGQGPTPQTATNCSTFSNFTATGTGKLGQLLGGGCVYPRTTKTLAGELAAPGEGGWRAYIEGMDTAATTRTAAVGRRRAAASADSRAARGSCIHPTIGAADPNAAPTATGRYVTWHNPFVYFQGLIDRGTCAADDIPLTRLARDLKSAKTTPALSYIAPGPCDDGSDQPCRPGAPAGLAPAQRFLQTVLPDIERSPAYRAGGLIAITFNEAPQTGPHADASSCCDQPTFPNLPASTTPASPTTTSTGTTPTSTTPAGATTTATTTPTTTGTTTATTTTTTTSTTTSTDTTPTTASTPTTTTTTTTTTPSSTGTGSPGGGQVGLLLISKYVKPGSTDVLDYFNHFSLLASLEHIFKLKPLGYAADPALPVFSSTVFNAGS